MHDVNNPLLQPTTTNFEGSVNDTPMGRLAIITYRNASTTFTTFWTAESLEQHIKQLQGLLPALKSGLIMPDSVLQVPNGRKVRDNPQA